MKKLIATAGLLLVTPMFTSAQEPDHQYRAKGYGFIAQERTLGFAAGGGGEASIYKRFGLGGDFVKAASHFGEHMLSGNLYYGLPSTRDFEPFVTAGVTLFIIPNTELGHVYGWNFGFGANCWLTKHAAMRLEFRDSIGGGSISPIFPFFNTYYTTPNNVASFRIGVAFR